MAFTCSAASYPTSNFAFGACVLLWEADPGWMPGAQQATPSLPEQDRTQERIRQKKNPWVKIKAV